MSSVVIAGNTSGSVTLSAPDVAGTTTLTLPTTSGTIAATNGGGVIPAAQLGTGTASSSTYLRGDGTWATVSTTPTTAQVLSATAGATAGDVGTYAFVWTQTLSTISANGTLAGSSFSGYACINATGANINSSIVAVAGTLSGTWKIMGYLAGSGSYQATVCLRIS